MRIKILTLYCLLGISVALQASEARNLGDFHLGLNTHHLTDEIDEHLTALDIGNTRIDINWKRISDSNGAIQTTNSEYQSILQAPILITNPLVILDYGHPAFDGGGRIVSDKGRGAFVRYAVSSVDLLKSRTKLYEVWNEWNVQGMGGVPLEEGTGKPEDYVKLLKSVYDCLKSHESSLVILGGATGEIGARDNYMEKILRLGALDSLDGLSIHPYFWGSKGEGRFPENALKKRFDTLRGWLSKYPKGPTFPIYVTELGWPTYDKGDGVTPEVQAKFMARSILILATDPQVKGVWIYELRDGGINPGDPEHHFGLINNDGTPKPAFWVMKDLKKVLDESKSTERMPVKAADSLVMMRMPNKEGGTRWLCWTILPDTRWKLRISGLGKDGAVKVSPLGRFGFPDGWRDEKEGAKIEIGDLPVCIESSSPNLVMESVGPVSSGSSAATPATRATKPSSAESERLPSY